jgi:hypothetical protein
MFTFQVGSKIEEYARLYTLADKYCIELLSEFVVDN